MALLVKSRGDFPSPPPKEETLSHSSSKSLTTFSYTISLSSRCFVSPGGNQGYNYQSGGQFNNANNYNFGSNSLDSYNNFGGRNSFPGLPSPTYGPAFR